MSIPETNLFTFSKLKLVVKAWLNVERSVAFRLFSSVTKVVWLSSQPAFRHGRQDKSELIIYRMHTSSSILFSLGETGYGCNTFCFSTQFLSYRSQTFIQSTDICLLQMTSIQTSARISQTLCVDVKYMVFLCYNPPHNQVML